VTSAPPTSPSSVDAQRLRWKVDQAAGGFVDGAWWPASRDLAAELPGLVAALDGRLDGVERVSFPIDDWDAVPRRLRVGDRVVRMGGFHSQPRATLLVTGGAYRTITLLVVPPETDADTAHAILAAASSAGNAEDVATLLSATAH
jgi:Family of unknown function (DUF5994)